MRASGMAGDPAGRWSSRAYRGWGGPARGEVVGELRGHLRSATVALGRPRACNGPELQGETRGGRDRHYALEKGPLHHPAGPRAITRPGGRADRGARPGEVGGGEGGSRSPPAAQNRCLYFRCVAFVSCAAAVRTLSQWEASSSRFCTDKLYRRFRIVRRSVQEPVFPVFFSTDLRRDSARRPARTALLSSEGAGTWGLYSFCSRLAAAAARLQPQRCARKVGRGECHRRPVPKIRNCRSRPATGVNRTGATERNPGWPQPPLPSGGGPAPPPGRATGDNPTEWRSRQGCATGRSRRGEGRESKSPGRAEPLSVVSLRRLRVLRRCDGCIEPVGSGCVKLLYRQFV